MYMYYCIFNIPVVPKTNHRNFRRRFGTVLCVFWKIFQNISVLYVFKQCTAHVLNFLHLYRKTYERTVPGAYATDYFLVAAYYIVPYVYGNWRNYVCRSYCGLYGSTDGIVHAQKWNEKDAGNIVIRIKIRSFQCTADFFFRNSVYIRIFLWYNEISEEY